MNLGIDIWTPFEAGEWTEDKEDLRVTVQPEVGFIKYDGKWILATRLARYLQSDDPAQNEMLIEDGKVTPLLEASREMRLDALQHFPAIVSRLQEAADGAINTIDNAEKFFK
jgi:hypothetical protein